MSKHSIQNDPEIQKWIENDRKEYKMKSHAIEFAEFSSRWCSENSSYEFDELHKETKDRVYKEFLNQKVR